MRDCKPVLYAEDDPADALLMRLAFERAGIETPLVVVPDGEDAMAYLNDGRGELPAPCLLITDLKMPKCDGFEVLAWLKAQPHLSELPAVALSSSNHDRDRERALKLGARDYLVKPSSLNELVELVKGLEASWIASGQAAGR